MKTLLQINSVVNTGSTGRIAEEIGQLAKDNGWKSYIAHGRTARTSRSEIVRIGSDLDIKLHGLQTRIFDRHGFGSKKATEKFIDSVAKINPDIIHLHNIHGYYLNVEVLFNYLKQAGKPVVWTLHDCWPFTGHCSNFDYVGCDKWKTNCHKCPLQKEYPASYFFDRSQKNYTQKKELFNSIENLTLVPVSQWLSGIVQQSFLKNYPVRVIHNGINTEVFKQLPADNIRIKYNLHNKFVLLGVATSWSSRKGLKDFMKLGELLDDTFKIILIGLNKKQLKQLPENIIGIERTEIVSELVEFYNAADLTLNLSAQETFGLTTVEGFACGTPGVVYNCTASPELITPETGIIAEKGNLQELVNAILLMKSKGKKHYSLECRSRAEKLYNKDDRFLEYIKLYERIR